jgi:UDP-N-acetylmuramoyl-L-alanyl-D-glutamate--2,6-diaminopimelate ligase
VIGRFNLDNALMAAACSLAAGIDFDDVVRGLPGLAGVPGRYEIVSGEDPITVIVDYAHTPDGIAEAIVAARELQRRQVIAVVGAGGDRDREKRPLMGEAASSADLVVITSDNPRTEQPEDIVASIVAGLDSSTASVIEIDRQTAIRRAIAAAEDGDIVLVLGRGHEPTQDIGGNRIPFDDRQVARDALRLVRSSADLDTKSGSMDT